MGKSTNIQIRIPDDLDQRLEKAIAQTSMNRNEFIRFALDEYLRKEYEQPGKSEDKMLFIIEKLFTLKAEMPIPELRPEDIDLDDKEAFYQVEKEFKKYRAAYQMYEKAFEEKHYKPNWRSMT